MESILQLVKKIMVFFSTMFINSAIKYFVLVFVFRTPDPLSGGVSTFVMERVFSGAYDETTCLDWSTDSRILAVGSKDMSTKLYPIEK